MLAPYNSEIHPDDTLEEEADVAFEPNALKFARIVREINRKYEQNNNGELDNGVINEEQIVKSEVDRFSYNNSSNDFEFNNLSEISCSEFTNMPSKPNLHI